MSLESRCTGKQPENQKAAGNPEQAAREAGEQLEKTQLALGQPV